MAISAADSVLAVVPMFHANAWGLPFAVPAVGAKLVLPGRQTDGASLAQLIDDEGVTIAVGIATVWLGLLEHLESQGGDVPTLKRIIVGGAALPPALMARIEHRLGVTVQTSWGMTELSPLGTVAPPDAPARSAALSGRPVFGVDLLLTDAQGRALPEQRGVEGHLRVRGAAVVERYFGEEQPATDSDGWFATGDLARIDADGNLIVTGRAKDLIKSGGEWDQPRRDRGDRQRPSRNFARRRHRAGGSQMGANARSCWSRPAGRTRSATRRCWPRCAAMSRPGGFPTRSSVCRACLWHPRAKSTRCG